MKRPRHRRALLSVNLLEPRTLLSGESGTWIGQDAHDLVGLSRVLGGDDVQDIHIAVTGLPADRTINLADIQGLGGGRWDSQGLNGWMAAVVRTPGATTADLYIEPYQVETGRPFDIHLTYDDGSTVEFWVTGGAADPNLRMPDAAVQARWIGQDGHDLVGDGPAVGPDGIQDVHLAISHLSAGVGIDSMTVDGPTGESWQFGLNHEADNNAELIRHSDDPTQADLFLNPIKSLAGQALHVSLVYSNGKTDSTILIGGASDPALHMPPVAPVSVAWNQVAGSWLGQDGLNLAGAGSVHLGLDGVPAGRTVVAAALSDGVGSWVYRSDNAGAFYADPFALPLAFQRTSVQASHADLGFAPIRDESNTTLTLRLRLDDGTELLTTLPGGFSDPSLRSARPIPGAVLAHPGDDLNDLANRFGSVHLLPGVYALSQPLVLNNPVTITAEPGAVLEFSQSASDAAWNTAVKIHSGNTTLDGFTIRFATPIRWDWSGAFGAAVIGTTNNLDPAGHNDPRAGITISHMTLITPPASSSWDEAPRMMRLVTAASGRIADNLIRGGATEFSGGPWTIVGNDYQGTVPGTFADEAFVGHGTHDLVLQGNTVQPVGASGKTWRFLVLTQRGSNDLISGNTVIGVGPRDNDTVPPANAAEVVLTESYRLHFEGKPAALSADGLIVQIPAPQGDPAQTGDVVAILSGPDAGQWRTITLALSPTTYVLDKPLPQGDYAISVTTGFTHETFQNNTIDCRGSSIAADLDLTGNHFGTRVIGNHLLGGGEGILISSSPSEAPVFWGWSHVPFLDGLIAANTIEDALKGDTLDVQHGPPVKSNQGRTYFDVTLRDNTVEWTSAFLTQWTQQGHTDKPVAWTIGNLGSIDPGELVVQADGNTVRGPVGYDPGNTLVIHSGTWNGVPEVDQTLSLPIAPPGPPLRLRVARDGSTRNGSVTADGQLQFDPVLGAAGYEYRVGSSATYTSIGTQTTFQAQGLKLGSNTVFVRSVDDQGRRGADAALTIVYAPVVPPSGHWVGQEGHDLVGATSAPDGIQDIRIDLANLPADRTIAFLDIQAPGGSDWESPVPVGLWPAAIVRAPGATTAALFIQPDRVETGRTFQVTLRFDDGSTASFSVQGGTADPALRMPLTLPAPVPVRKPPSKPLAALPGATPPSQPSIPSTAVLGLASAPAISVIGPTWARELFAAQVPRGHAANHVAALHSARPRIGHALFLRAKAQPHRPPRHA